MKRLILPILLALAPCRAGEIHDAVRKRDLAAVGQLLKKNPRLIESHTFPDYRTPLHHAIGTGDAAMVKRLLAAGANVKATDAMGATAVLRASIFADDASFERLIGEVTSWLKGAAGLDTVFNRRASVEAAAARKYRKPQAGHDRGVLTGVRCEGTADTKKSENDAIGATKAGKNLLMK